MSRCVELEERLLGGELALVVARLVGDGGVQSLRAACFSRWDVVRGPRRVAPLRKLSCCTISHA